MTDSRIANIPPAITSGQAVHRPHPRRSSPRPQLARHQVILVSQFDTSYLVALRKVKAMKTGYIDPAKVTAPKARWTDFEIIHDTAENTRDGGWSLAVGFWDEKRCLAIRWNGTEEIPRGSPKSSNNPTWFILPEELEGAILSSDAFRVAKWHLAKEFLERVS